MGRCTFVRPKKRKLCIGDLDTLIEIQSRELVVPFFESTDFDLNFTPNFQAWAAIETVNGQVFFDGTNEERRITHNIYIQYNSTVTAESWILLNGRRLDILEVNNLDEQDKWLLLICTDRGTDQNESTKS